METFLHLMESQAFVLGVIAIAGTVLTVFVPPVGAIFMRVAIPIGRVLPQIMEEVNKLRDLSDTEKEHVAVSKVKVVTGAAGNAVLKLPAVDKALRKKIRKSITLPPGTNF